MATLSVAASFVLPLEFAAFGEHAHGVHQVLQGDDADQVFAIHGMMPRLQTVSGGTKRHSPINLISGRGNDVR